MMRLICTGCVRFTRWLPLWTLGLAILGYIHPPLLTWISKDFINWFFALTMFGIGLALDIDLFIPTLKRPQWVFLGNITQFTVMPALGFFAGIYLGGSNDILVGFVLVGAVPGAMASNVISYLARADVAYSVLMTTSATLLAPLLTPAITKALVGASIEIPFWSMSWQVLWLTAIPIVLGISIRRFVRRWVEPLEPLSSALASLAIVVICAYIIAVNQAQFVALNVWVFVAVVLMNALGMIFGYAAGVLYRLDEKRRRALSFQIGMQNAGLGAVLAINNFSPSTALPSALFATWCVLTASFLAGIWGRR